MDKSWKQFERRIAKAFSGQRRGASTSDGFGAGKSDIIMPLDTWSIECKLLSRPSFSTLLEATRQSERNCEGTQTPIAIVKRKRDLDDDSLVVMRLKTWLEWYGPDGDAE